VGATDLLSSERGEVITADLTMPLPSLAAAMEGLLADRGRLQRCGAAAARAARGWTEAANAAALVELVRMALEHAARGGRGCAACRDAAQNSSNLCLHGGICGLSDGADHVWRVLQGSGLDRLLAKIGPTQA
jgi:hypothetical protein